MSGTSKVCVAMSVTAFVVAIMFGIGTGVLNQKIKAAMISDPSAVMLWQENFNAALAVTLAAAVAGAVMLIVAAVVDYD